MRSQNWWWLEIQKNPAKNSQTPLQGLMILRLFHQPPNYRDKAAVDGFPWISQKKSYGQIPGEVRRFFNVATCLGRVNSLLKIVILPKMNIAAIPKGKDRLPVASFFGTLIFGSLQRHKGFSAGMYMCPPFSKAFDITPNQGAVSRWEGPRLTELHLSLAAPDPVVNGVITPINVLMNGKLGL